MMKVYIECTHKIMNMFFVSANQRLRYVCHYMVVCRSPSTKILHIHLYAKPNVWWFFSGDSSQTILWYIIRIAICEIEKKKKNRLNQKYQHFNGLTVEHRKAQFAHTNIYWPKMYIETEAFADRCGIIIIFVRIYFSYPLRTKYHSIVGNFSRS